MIEFRQVSKVYDERAILSEFNLTIESGSFLTIVGTSGSGKTTILKMINGLIRPDKGAIFVEKQSIAEQNPIPLRRKMGYAIQGNVLFPHLTVAENIAYVLDLEGVPSEEKEQIVLEKLHLVGLSEDLLHHYPEQLSGGQAQRVGIARSLAASPSILLMDEPFGAVDAITRYQLQKELKELHKMTQMTIVFITHDIAEALKLGTKILVLDDGVIQQIGSPSDIVHHPATDFVRELVEIAGVTTFEEVG